ncbi:hypothetical protein [Candidatus Leptofilum sp.]|uniref:hypothetical protein n=1 Tax=Candidatus Leptofilum sp. TaxID=3241576 RepID=UPI003B5A06BC
MLLKSNADNWLNFKKLGFMLLICVLLGVFSSLFPFETAATIFIAIGTLVTTIIIIKKPFVIVLFLTIFIPFEDFVIKFIPVSDPIQLALRLMSELLIYSTLTVTILKKMIQGKSIRLTRLEHWLIIFIFAGIFSSLLNSASLGSSIINLRAIIRYIFLFYLLVNLNLSPKQNQKLLNAILAIGAVQIIIGAIQIITRGSINSFLLPTQTNIEIAGVSRGAVLLNRGREIGSIFGTLGDTIFLALFLLIVLVIFLGKNNLLRLKTLAIIAILFGAINYTFARGVVLAALFAVILYAIIYYGKNRLVIGSILGVPFAILAIYTLVASSAIYRDFNNPLFEEIGILDNFTGILTIDYFERAQNQRLGALIGIPPTVLANAPAFGFGLDESLTVSKLNESNPSYMLREIDQNGFEDVYWTAILSYTGLLGLLSFAMIFTLIGRKAKQIFRKAKHKQTKQLAAIVLCLTVLTAFLLFFYRVVEFRAFSYYYWLLAGLMLSSYIQEKARLRNL